MTILFYSAVHYVDAFLAGKNYHPRNHDARDAEIENNGSITGIYRDYRRLKDQSEAARYEIANFHKSQLPKIEAKFKNVKEHILKMI